MIDTRFVIGNDGTSIRDTRIGKTIADAMTEEYAGLICGALEEYHRRRDDEHPGYDPNEGMTVDFGRQAKITGMEPRHVNAKVRKPRRDQCSRRRQDQTAFLTVSTTGLPNKASPTATKIKPRMTIAPRANHSEAFSPTAPETPAPVGPSLPVPVIHSRGFDGAVSPPKRNLLTAAPMSFDELALGPPGIVPPIPPDDPPNHSDAETPAFGAPAMNKS